MKVGVVGEIHNSGYEIFEKNNIEYFVTSSKDDDQLKDELSDVDGIVVRTVKLSKNVLANAKKLKVVARHGVGYDNVDSNFLNDNKIALAITGTANAVSVSEHVMTMMLCLTKNIYESDKLVKLNKFKDKANLPNFFELYQKKILILGFGRIGKALAKRCRAFDMEVYIHDPFISDDEIRSMNYIPTDKENGFKIADYISIHLPLNSETRDLISFKQFEVFKSNLILINTARGGIVNENALFDALKNKKIFAAGLDVFEVEPPIENHMLFSLQNTLLSPHNSALTLECRRRMAIESCENVFNFLTKSKKLNQDNIINFHIIN